MDEKKDNFFVKSNLHVFALQTKKNDDFLIFSLLDQEEKKDAEEEEVVKDEENSKENQGVGDAKVEEPEQEDKQPSPEDCGVQEEKKTMTEEKTKVPRGQRRPKSLHIKVTLLDNTEFQCELDVRATHQPLFFINCA